MGESPVNPRPEQPQFPQSGGSGQPAAGMGSPSGPGYGFPPGPGQAQGYGQPQPPLGAPATPGASPYGAPASPYTAPASPYGAPASPYSAPASPHSAPAGPYGGPPAPQPSAQGPSAGAPSARPYGPGTSPYSTPAPSAFSAPPANPYTPANPYGPPSAPPAGAKPAKSRKGLVIGILAGVVALILVAVIGVVVFLQTQKTNAANTAPDKAIKSTTALQGYLEALAAGDADKAKQYAMNPPADSPLLTNDFLKASVTKNPITEILVNPMTDYGTTSYATASYRIGTALVQGNYEMTKVGNVWKVNDVVAKDKRPAEWGKLAVTINGTPLTGDTVTLFPGVYELSTGTSLVEFTTSTFTIKEPSAYVSSLMSADPKLSAKGKTTMIAAAQDWLKQCLAVQDTNPKGCGMNTPLPDGATLAPGTLTRKVTSSGTPFANASPRISYDDPLIVTMSDYISIDLAAKDTAGKSYDGTASIATVTGTISGDTITVVFDE